MRGHDYLKNHSSTNETDEILENTGTSFEPQADVAVLTPAPPRRRLGRTLALWEGTLQSSISRSPLLVLPYLFALPLFLLLLGALSPVITPGLNFSFHAAGIPLPQDGKVTHYLFTAGQSPKTEEETADAAPRILPVKTQTYTVQSGDMLSVLANRFNIDVSTLISFNDIADVRHIAAGDKLLIPNEDGLLYTVHKGDSLTSIARANNLSYDDILLANGLKSPVVTPGQKVFLPGVTLSAWDYKQALGELFIYPARGVITSRFGWRHDPFNGDRTFHNGVDIANYAGTPVHASMAGRVADMGFNSAYGNYILLSHEGGYQTLYGHLRAFEVSQGEWVRQGQVIGLMGSTGYSTGPHVHFSIFKWNHAVNPLNYLF